MWEIAHILRLPIGYTEARIPKAKFVLDERAAKKIPAIRLTEKEPHRIIRMRLGKDIDRRNKSPVVTVW